MKTKKPKSIQEKLLLAIFIITAFVFIPTTVLLFVGMLPTVVARFADRSIERTKVLTIGFMNFAGCFPVWFQMVKKGHTLGVVSQMLSNPTNLVTMYGGALAGYVIEWGVTLIVAGLMVQKAKSRMSDIKKIQAELVRKWGPEVSGELPLDEQGFPIDK